MKNVELTDAFHQEEPLGYLVSLHNQTLHEYMVFANHDEAVDCAVRQEEEYHDETGELIDWPIYPLYASHAISESPP